LAIFVICDVVQSDDITGFLHAYTWMGLPDVLMDISIHAALNIKTN
jgi:hypothetical protein